LLCLHTKEQEPGRGTLCGRETDWVCWYCQAPRCVVLCQNPVAKTGRWPSGVGRWTIEKYFKALKTDCQYEKRQLESAHSLLNALAILAPVAWRLVLLRHLARNAPKRSASDALTPTELEV